MVPHLSAAVESLGTGAAPLLLFASTALHALPWDLWLASRLLNHTFAITSLPTVYAAATAGRLTSRPRAGAHLAWLVARVPEMYSRGVGHTKQGSVVEDLATAGGPSAAVTQPLRLVAFAYSAPQADVAAADARRAAAVVARHVASWTRSLQVRRRRRNAAHGGSLPRPC